MPLASYADDANLGVNDLTGPLRPGARGLYLKSQRPYVFYHAGLP